MACLREQTDPRYRRVISCSEEGCQLRRLQIGGNPLPPPEAPETDCILQLRLRARALEDTKGYPHQEIISKADLHKIFDVEPDGGWREVGYMSDEGIDTIRQAAEEYVENESESESYRAWDGLPEISHNCSCHVNKQPCGVCRDLGCKLGGDGASGYERLTEQDYLWAYNYNAYLNECYLRVAQDLGIGKRIDDLRSSRVERPQARTNPRNRLLGLFSAVRRWF